MTLLDNLYTITSEQQCDGQHHYTISLNAEHFIYKAHFPGEPITPGVCIMQIAHELLEQHSGLSLGVQCVKNVKFLRIINPQECPELTYTLQRVSREEDCLKAQAVVSVENDIYAKLSLVCQITAQ